MKNDAAAEWVGIDSISAWEQNPRRNDAAVAEIAKSIQRFGFGAPILARAQDRVVIAGHTRLKAARQLGLDKVPVRFLNLDPAEARALALTDNKLGEIAEWDDGLLSEVLSELEQDGVDLAGLGWSSEELEALLSSGGEEEEEDASSDEDVIPTDAPAITTPGEVISLGRHTLRCGDCLAVMAGLSDSSVDAIVTDPPYGIGFMGKAWDVSVPGELFAREALRVLKPGGHLVAFAATRTVHRLAVALEDAGFEIRDMIAWLQWQGFPKSLDVSKAIDAHHGMLEEREPDTYRPNYRNAVYGAGMGGGVTQAKGAAASADRRRWQGWGTALKPAQEPAVLARKPLAGTVAETVLAHGTGALNIDGCRYGENDPAWPGPSGGEGGWGGANGFTNTHEASRYGGLGSGEPRPVEGRWPANLYYCPKPSDSERHPDLSAGLTGKDTLCSCSAREQSWASEDRNPGTDETAASLRRGIGASGSGGGSSWNTATSGSRPTDPSPRASRSTTSTGTSSTTGSKTSKRSMASSTSASTPGVTSAMGSGGSPAPSAGSPSPSTESTGTSAGRAGLSTVDAVPATSASSSRASSNGGRCGRCGKPRAVRNIHETVKPVLLIRWLTRLVTPPGGTILEPFCGSGTTLLAAEKEGMVCIAVEKEPKYCDIIRARYTSTQET